jgi:hypothetical protein
MIDAATQTWAAVVGCPDWALTGRYQLRQVGNDGMGYSHLQDPWCRIVDTHRSIWFDTITSEVFEGCLGEEVSLAIGIEAVRLLNEGAPMPLNISEIREDLLWDDMINEQEDGA